MSSSSITYETRLHPITQKTYKIYNLPEYVKKGIALSLKELKKRDKLLEKVRKAIQALKYRYGNLQTSSSKCLKERKIFLNERTSLFLILSLLEKDSDRHAKFVFELDKLYKKFIKIRNKVVKQDDDFKKKVESDEVLKQINRDENNLSSLLSELDEHFLNIRKMAKKVKIKTNKYFKIIADAKKNVSNSELSKEIGKLKVENDLIKKKLETR